VTPELNALVRLSLIGYAHLGTRLARGATAFMLLALRPGDDDELRANATLICPDCVAQVASTALSVIDQRERGRYPVRSPGGAVDFVGPALLYDLIGVSELPFCAGCAECRSHIPCQSGCSDCRAPDCPCRCRTIGHTPTEALLCRICGTDLRSSDTIGIAREVERARREGRIIGDSCARAIAAQWFDSFYRGFVTHGYTFVSTGAIPASLGNAWDLLGITDWTEAHDDHPDHPVVAALNRYLRHHGPREPVPGWADVWIRR
jgi:hypothetical protein